ncbi:hypothetical protein [Embleya sp. NPDC059259]|uniref:hypothetical protein n=1 Tax=unclassified Embleya TaxID=2699296 RepID=UPI0036C5BF86
MNGSPTRDAEAAVDAQPGPGATPPPVRPALRAAAEPVGTAAPVVVGAGIQATEPTDDVGVRLLANTIATVFGRGADRSARPREGNPRADKPFVLSPAPTTRAAHPRPRAS